MGIPSREKKIRRALAAALVLLLAGGVFAGSCFAEKADAPAAPAADAKTMTESDWAVRCSDGKPPGKTAAKNCEIFKLLQVSQSHMRVAEFAASFPDPANTDLARGAVVLPLGILFDQGVTMKVDDNKPFVFRPQYCTNAGCFALIDLTKAVLDQMKKGEAVHFLFRTMTGQNVDLSLKLSGFGKTLKQVTQ